MSQQDPPPAQSTADAVRAVATAVAASEFRQAAELADSSLSFGLIHPALYNARALWAERQGRDEEALQEFQRARALAPKDPHILNAVGLCLTRLYRLDEALDAFDEAIRIDPAYSATHQRKGVVLGMAGRPAAAETAHRRAISLQPGNVEALASVASIAARNGDARPAETYATRALAIDPRNATAHAALALVEISRGEFALAEQRLRPLLDGPQLLGHGRAVVLGLLGDALDGLGRYPEAFAVYGAANAELRKLHAPRFRGRTGMLEMVEKLIAYFDGVAGEAWNAVPHGEPVDQPARLHVFLLGFYRSGTTLLEQVLESHPDIATLEERDFLAEPAEHYLTSPEGLDRLSMLDEKAVAILRTTYWQRVRDHRVATEGKVFVDKHPLNTVKLPLIRKLFPQAKILFALRDPRDVVLSCFRRHFEINATMYEFLTLDGTARLYDRVMSFAETCRGMFPLELFEHRYEDMIADFDGRIRAVCEFLVVPYSETMQEFAGTAHNLDIRSPSAQQVRRGLYSEGLNQWRRYQAELASALPLLEPWVKRFGYAPG